MNGEQAWNDMPEADRSPKTFEYAVMLVGSGTDVCFYLLDEQAWEAIPDDADLCEAIDKLNIEDLAMFVCLQKFVEFVKKHDITLKDVGEGIQY